MIPEKNSQSPTLKKITVQIYLLEKYTLRHKSLEKIITKAPPGILFHLELYIPISIKYKLKALAEFLLVD